MKSFIWAPALGLRTLILFDGCYSWSTRLSTASVLILCFSQSSIFSSLPLYFSFYLYICEFLYFWIVNIIERRGKTLGSGIHPSLCLSLSTPISLLPLWIDMIWIWSVTGFLMVAFLGLYLHSYSPSARVYFIIGKVTFGVTISELGINLSLIHFLLLSLSSLF